MLQSKFSIRIDLKTPKSRRDTLNLTFYLESIFLIIPLIVPIVIINSTIVIELTIVTKLTTTISLIPIYFLDSS